MTCAGESTGAAGAMIAASLIPAGEMHERT
jgi:hypothetical protein